MPELPEVETVRKGLEQLVLQKKISEVSVYWPRIIDSPEVELFTHQLIGETIEQVNRRGKFLIFSLTHVDMVSHLRMEGKYEFHQNGDALAKHTHVVFRFDDGTELRYLDVRKFGRMTLLEKGAWPTHPGIRKLGPEPVSEQFHLAPFREGLKRSAKAVKPLLLEQKLVTGLGNIYVDEALFRSRIHPLQEASTLTKQETAVLHSEIIAVLAEAVAAGGTTIRTYQNALGEAGKFQVALSVYGQTGKPCPVCGTPIEKIKVAQRGTHYCPTCQKYRKRVIKQVRA
ncbi:DNA-formamidopyrimidine glycosylase [Vagococcus acidifermentans]|uniref:Formamidopyrimidine-DNA glycosylase n=1 Tax=Vagococcus acidifermentans TaxID=564710 RepID=A0A430AP61_9ENTE|nr:DNA-formamidopyrimidine glycosylase [Vagococcus acidifermentans]RSU09911.1 DNA-formamidopyrimidine glycosylase [Vagococcus acidifermentans]